MKGNQTVFERLNEWLGGPSATGGGRQALPSQLQLCSLEDWAQLIELTATEPVVVFKHSTSCGTSAHALSQFGEFISNETNLRFAILEVIQNRPVSNLVAEHLGVRHQTPQIIVVRNGLPVWHASHWMIDHGKLKEAVA